MVLISSLLTILSIIVIVILFSGIIYSITRKRYDTAIGLVLMLVAYIILNFIVK